MSFLYAITLHSYEIQPVVLLMSRLGSHIFWIFRFCGRTDHQTLLHISVGKPYLRSHLKLITQSKVNATDTVKYAIGVLDSAFTCQQDLIRQNDRTDLIPTCRRNYFKSLRLRVLESDKNKLHTMPLTSTKDTEFGDCYFDDSNTDKRLIRATLKTYERTRTYVFLKLFKITAEEYEFDQRILLTLQEFGNVVKTAEDILESEEKSAKDSSTKQPPNKRPKLLHESKVGGSNV